MSCNMRTSSAGSRRSWAASDYHRLSYMSKKQHGPSLYWYTSTPSTHHLIAFWVYDCSFHPLVVADRRFRPRTPCRYWSVRDHFPVRVGLLHIPTKPFHSAHWGRDVRDEVLCLVCIFVLEKRGIVTISACFEHGFEGLKGPRSHLE